MIYELEYWDGGKIRQVAVEADSCDSSTCEMVEFFKYIDTKIPFGREIELFATFWNPVSLIKKEEGERVLPIGSVNPLHNMAKEETSEFYRQMGIK
jgi:hypothetical protein